MLYSVLIPAHNESGNIPALLREIDEVMRRMDLSFEIILVDDGSADETYTVARDLRQRYPYLRIIKFRRNSGQSAALDAGIQQARGEAIITIDADRQNDPNDIEKLLEYFPEFDVVIGIRSVRMDTFFKRAQSKIANAIRNRLTDDDIVDTGCSLKIFRADFLKRIMLYDGLHRFLPTLCRIHGARIRQVPVSDRPRVWGKSHYGMSNRAFRALLDAFAVRWMARRTTRYEIERIDE